MIDVQSLLTKIDTLSTNDGERDYLGASSIGEECQRKLWLQFHRYVEPEQFEPRMLRLFQRGKDEELKFETYIHEIGIKILHGALDQIGFKKGFFGGHGDGVYLIEDKRVAAEQKTHNDASFKKLVPGGLKHSHPKHYAQSIVYAGEFNCVGTLYMAVNKNTDELFFDFIPFNQEDFDGYHAKAEYVTMADKPPERIAKRPTDFACKFCHAKDVCWGFSLPRVNCRNCVNVEKHKEHGSFGCELKKPSDSNFQLDERGWCESHCFNPYAMNDLQGWQIVEFHPEHKCVEYANVINGPAPFGVPSKELKL